MAASCGSQQVLSVEPGLDQQRRFFESPREVCLQAIQKAVLDRTEDFVDKTLPDGRQVIVGSCVRGAV